MSRIASTLCLLVLWPGLASASDLMVHDAWVRLPPPGANGAAYMELHNPGAAPIRILAVTCPAAERAEMHRSVVEEGVARMRPVEAIEVPAGERVSLEPGGLHLMLIRPKGLQLGGGIDLTLELEGGERVAVRAQVRRRAAAKDGAAQEHHH